MQSADIPITNGCFGTLRSSEGEGSEDEGEGVEEERRPPESEPLEWAPEAVSIALSILSDDDVVLLGES